MKKIFVFVILFILRSNANTTPCQEHQDQTAGKFTCTYKNTDDLTNYACNVNNHECEATKVSFTPISPPTGKGTLTISIQITLKSYETGDLTVTVSGDDISNTNVKLSNGIKLKYPFKDIEKPRVECGEFQQAIDGFTAFSVCNAYLPKSDGDVTKSDEIGCTYTLKKIPALKSKHLFLKQTILKFVNTPKECNLVCSVSLNIPDQLTATTQKKTTISYTWKCQEPTLYTIGHDEHSRKIFFSVNSMYDFTKVEVSVKSGSVSLKSPNTFTLSNEAKTSTDELSYKIDSPAEDTIDFKLEFKVYQSGNKLVSTVEKSYSTKPTMKETNWISCKPKEQCSSSDQRKCIFVCSIVSKASSVTLKTDSTTYTLENDNFQLTNTNGINKKDDIDVTIVAPSTTKCNHVQNIKLYFTDAQNNEHSFKVTHLNICKEPVIECLNHDTDERKISCRFVIDYDFTEIRIDSSNDAVILNPKTIEFTIANGNQFSREISYKIDDLRKESSSYFKITFTIMQAQNIVSFSKILGFEFVVKQEDTPFIRCDVNPNNKLQYYASVAYKCKAVSPSWTIELKSKTDGYTIEPKTINGYNQDKIYKFEFDLTITPTAIKCSHKNEVLISFTENKVDYEFTVTHITTCPEPLILCSTHDTVQRQITCNLKIIFDYQKIKVTSDDGKVVITNVEVTSVEIQASQNSFTFQYSIHDLKQVDHQFKLKYEILHASQVVAFEKVLGFVYQLKQNEIPGLVCKEKDRGSNLKYHETEYSCDIVSLSKPDELKVKETSKFTRISHETITENVVHGIQRINQKSIKISLTSKACNQKNDVTLFFEDRGTKHEFVVTHETNCPEPEIYCDKHDFITRKLTCKIKIEFAFTTVDLTHSDNIEKLDPTTISKQNQEADGSDDKFEKDVDILYFLEDVSKPDNKFNIIFEIKQTGNTNPPRKTLSFQYLLKPTEIPQIVCKENPAQSADKFDERSYKCTVISKVKKVMLKIDNPLYSLVESVESNGNNHLKLFKQDNIEVKIKINKVICNKMEKVLIYYLDDDMVTRYSDSVSHITICPLPTIKSFETDDSKRTLKWTVSAEFEFTDIKFEPDVSSIEIESKAGKLSFNSGKYERAIEVTYKPIDWSIDQHTFSVINLITPSQSAVVRLTTNAHTFTLKKEETPSVECHLKNIDQKDYFPQKVYTCIILSRQSTVLLQSRDQRYAIKKLAGDALFENRVYNWRGFQILLKDLQIKCHVDASVEIFFTEYTRSFSSKITHKTLCPNPEILFQNHDIEKRIIECRITSKFPHTAVDISAIGISNIILTNVKNSAIDSVNEYWISTHHIFYNLLDLLDDNHGFEIKVTVLQDSLEILTEKKSFTYVIAEHEKPQITCQANPEKNKTAFATTSYLCYIVANKQEITISTSENRYLLNYLRFPGDKFVNLFRWIDLEVSLNDTEIHCNTTKTITLQSSVMDGLIYESQVEHTTHCDEIIGDCNIVYNIAPYILCHFHSGQEFWLNHYNCSEIMNCTLPANNRTTFGKNQEILLDILPLTSELIFEFELNVTFSYSMHSHIQSRFYFDYSKDGVEIQKVAAAAVQTRVTSSSIIIAIILACSLLLVYQLMNKKYSYPVIVNSMKQYYASL